MSGRAMRCDERPLCDDPQRFAEIFGSAEYPLPSLKKLLAAVALIEVKDYLSRPRRIKNRAARAKIERRKAEASRYLFEPDPEPTALAFAAICEILEVDPDYARRGIRARTPAEIRAIMRRLTHHRAKDEL